MELQVKSELVPSPSPQSTHEEACVWFYQVEPLDAAASMDALKR